MPGESYLVAGLGNIGPEYASTRHNMGFMTLDAWAQASNVVFETRRYGDVAVIKTKGRKFILLKPSTYMNLSGEAVRYYVNELEIPLERVVVICDDINLPFGTLRMRKSGSDGGHNGLKNITDLLGTQEWARIRMGVGHEFGQGQQVDFVLGELSGEQKEKMPELTKKVSEAVLTWAFLGADRAMTELNSKKNQ